MSEQKCRKVYVPVNLDVDAEGNIRPRLIRWIDGRVYNPAASLSAKGGTPKQEKKALTDEQVKILLDTIRGLPPYVFVMIGLYAGLRREEILALRWDCVFLDEATPYISVRRAWRSVNNRPVISTELKTPAAKRDIPIPGKLVECLKEAKEKSKSEYVISDRNGNALAESQFVRVWKYIAVRSTEERCYYTYVNGQKIKHVVKPKLGEHQPNNPKLVYTMDFQVTPHQLRHTYITNLIYASVDPKTVQYLAGHENSKVTIDMSKIESSAGKALYEQQETKLSQQSAAFIELLTKRGILGDSSIDDDRVRQAKKEKKKSMYHNTLLLLQHYRTILWTLECFPSSVAEELDRPLKDLDTLLDRIDLELGMNNRKLEGRMESVRRSRLLVDRLNDAVSILKSKPVNGNKMYDIIYMTFLGPDKLMHEELLYRLDISARHYYRLRTQAINIIALRLWSAPAGEVDSWLEVLSILENW